jgi:very-short-patch-repair endonuclease
MNSETIARVVAALNQHDGLLTVATAKDEGIGKTTLTRAAEAGVMRRTGRNRYSSLDAPPRLLAYRGANLGQDAVLSYRGAAYFWALDGVDQLLLEWSIPHGGRASTPLVYRRRKFDELDVVEKNGVVVTSVPQTILDVGARCDVDTVERAYESALRTGLIDDIEMRDFAARHASWHGAPTLRAVLARRLPGERPTGSDVETIGLQVYRRAGMHPRRQWEVRDERDELLGFGDFGWPPKAFITEFDGLEAHGPEQRQYDYNRQARIEDVGYIFRRFTREDVLHRPKYLVDTTRRGIAIARYL